jgi:hypothetical protein
VEDQHHISGAHRDPRCLWPGAVGAQQQLSKEYVRLGGRAIAIENAQAGLAASFTISKNGSAYTQSVTANVGDNIKYQWTSTGGVSYAFYDTISPNNADGCINRSGPTSFSPPAGGTAGPFPLLACQAGYTYTMIYTVTAANGATAYSTITIAVSQTLAAVPANLTAPAGDAQVSLSAAASPHPWRDLFSVTPIAALYLPAFQSVAASSPSPRRLPALTSDQVTLCLPAHPPSSKHARPPAAQEATEQKRAMRS